MLSTVIKPSSKYSFNSQFMPLCLVCSVFTETTRPTPYLQILAFSIPKTFTLLYFVTYSHSFILNFSPGMTHHFNTLKLLTFLHYYQANSQLNLKSTLCSSLKCQLNTILIK